MTRRTVAGGFALVAIVVAAASPATLSAASPSPSAAPSAAPSEPPLERPPIEVWLDRPLPPDPSPGTALDVGATLWDALGHEIPRMGATIFLRAVPPGGAEPTQAVAISDWRGHYRGTVQVPDGGLDHVELGVTGTICENDVCRPDDWVFDLAGTGPPPEASITTLAEARIDLGDATPRAGRPAEVTVVVEPIADWESLKLPAGIVVRAREARGPNLATATLPLVDPAAGRYEGSITIPTAGDLVLEAATDEDGGDATRFGTSMVRVAVQPGGDGAAEPPAPGAAADEGLPTIVVLLLAAVAVVGAGVILAGFRSGGR
jgi:hypothetical protein